ncbi:MAG: RnfABCDGE type electron transport complex subunit D [Planctomycetes bacterium]|nr:RnfABCDGE type electron transport complex subunit D [Planctomycetota bacterium]
MSARHPLVVQTAPFLHAALSTPRLMREVALAAVPVLAAATWFFGITALLVVGAATLGAVGAERTFGPRSATLPRGRSLRDFSAVLTGILLGLTLPPGIPLWMAFVGGAVSICLGKLVWGGLGHNLFNPALVGRAFLQAAFPTTLTAWVPHTNGDELLVLRSSTFAWPLMQAHIDGLTAATPLARLKFEGHTEAWDALLLGNISGSLGETSAIVLIVCGLVLVWRRAFDWRIPAAILLTVAVVSGVLWGIDSTRYGSPLFMLLSGGLLFGTVFMATDPVSSPATPRGAWIFGIGVGVLVVLIRVWGGLPEGVMYAILLMNAATPLIERIAQPRPFGRGRTT